ncbi:MAG: hypothetical protein NT013_12165, partial [Planctomycetia bacterium]|nr:hypothetical protein [Planctomycetia bacterium]
WLFNPLAGKTINRRAGCGKPARPVRREGRPKSIGRSYPYRRNNRAIQVNDRLLLVLSEQSINSEWVQTEIRKVRQAELREQRQKRFPSGW